LGYLGTNMVAVLLLSTDKSGAEHFAQKVGSSAMNLGFFSSIQTYPGDSLNREPSAREPGRGPDSTPVVAEEWHQSRRFGYPGKRLLDIVGSMALTVLLSPVFVLTALAVKLTSRGPVIFSQTRLGAGGRPFVFYKFRSMRCGSDDRIHKDYV